MVVHIIIAIIILPWIALILAIQQLSVGRRAIIVSHYLGSWNTIIGLKAVYEGLDHAMGLVNLVVWVRLLLLTTAHNN